MKFPYVFFLVFALIQEVPLKPKDEFDIKIDYQFKNRPAADVNSVHLDETKKEYERRVSTALLPFLTLNVKMLKLNDGEVKMKVMNNLTTRVATRKVAEGTTVPIEVGFTDDAKDRVTAHHYVLMLIDAKKNETSKIEIMIEEDGTFLVNGEKRGKF